MNIKVAKFGGTSLSDAKHFSLVRNIILSSQDRRYIVPSAPGKRNQEDDKITDLLLRCYSFWHAGMKIDNEFSKIIFRFEDIINKLGIPLDLSHEYSDILESLKEESADRIASRGEYITAKILSKYLNYDFVDAKECIMFDSDGVFLPEETNARAGEILQYHPYAVIPGFYGAMPNGKIKTFTRGGSDITGAIIARAVTADFYENWTDIDGFKMADPRIVANPKTIKIVTYREMRELSYMGANVLHEDTVFPVRRAGIPIHIRNTNSPEKKGSLIVGYRRKEQDDEIIGIAGKTGYVGIQIEKENLSSFPHLHCEICSIFDQHGIPISHIKYGIDSITVYTTKSNLAQREFEILTDISDALDPDTIYAESGIALIAVVGNGIAKNRDKVLSQICSCLRANDIVMKMCDSTGSEISIFVGVSEEYFALTQRALYSYFQLDK